MKKSHDVEDRRLRRKTAAFRLKHDVGKALRWSAPEERETDAGALRARLAGRPRLGRASSGPAGATSCKSSSSGRGKRGRCSASGDPDLERWRRHGRRCTAWRPAFFHSKNLLSSSLLSSPPLLALDDACLEASRACTAFYRRVAVEEGPEIVRPFGRRGGGA